MRLPICPKARLLPTNASSSLIGSDTICERVQILSKVPHGVLAGMFGQHPTPSVFPRWGLGGSITAPHVEPGGTPHAWLQIMIVNNGVVMARDVYVNFRMHGPGGDGFWSLREPPSSWQLTQSIGGWHVVADDRFRVAPSALHSCAEPDTASKAAVGPRPLVRHHTGLLRRARSKV